MISVREIADDNSSISSTRWAFASIIKVDIFCVVLIIVCGLVGHFIGKPLDSSFYASSAMLLGVITGIITTSKSLQGFEPNKKKEEKINQESISSIEDFDVEGK
jgi:hypothetical protein